MLALQGAYRAHRQILERLGATVYEVKRPETLARVDALVMPGGESTTMSMLLDRSGLREPLAQRLEGGMPALGTCAGAILLATEVLDGRPDQRSFGVLDLTVRRNGFGRQLASFEAEVALEGASAASPGSGSSCHAVFIRAPRIERVGPGVTVTARLDGEPVAVSRGAVWATTFHPELAADHGLHRAWLAATTEAFHAAGSMLA
ncbi:MAG: pyridoxal 5'-phosphate synthase glutaminase subunit PdxT [Microthrixaceae bacterium]